MPKAGHRAKPKAEGQEVYSAPFSGTIARFMAKGRDTGRDIGLELLVQSTTMVHVQESHTRCRYSKIQRTWGVWGVEVKERGA